jgi:DNA-binding beta-propeller fold protein YncE
MDGAGNLYIADFRGHRIRKVSPDGIITTVVGTGDEGFSGDGGPAISAKIGSPSNVAVDSAGNLYILDPNNKRIREVVRPG